ncbi:Collagen alpha-1(XI) chain [Platysternon megacephalum]|uniref:Collagen alpha-1(XI) chain n=1 Tax=Platysternon megacephalum TaxID=55544 RepID=A0A4D9DK64_9SAUR|nr:Collagen alpha-1(XI) chain [Platysternon megacephalum]
MEDAAVDTLGGEPYYYYGEANESGPGAHCEWPADWEVSFLLLPVLYMLVFVLGLSGNGLVNFTVWQSPRAKRHSADTYIGNLALADLAFVRYQLLAKLLATTYSGYCQSANNSH